MPSFKPSLSGKRVCQVLLLCGATHVVSAQESFGPDIESRLSGLSEEQMAFLDSEAPLRVVPSREKLALALSLKSSDQIAEYVDDMMAAVDALAFDPETDMEAMPLNPDARVFNRLVREPPALWEIRRDPGPFSVHRYIKPEGGIPTFAGAPVALNADDLVVGDVDVVFAGVPQSMGSGYRDGRYAPRTLRGMHGMVDRHIYTMVDPGAVLNLADYGDVPVDRMSLEMSLDSVVDVVTEMAETGAIPFLVGGDHSMMYPTVKAVTAVRGETPLTVIHLGAHFNGKPMGAHTLSDQIPVRRLLDEGLVQGSNLIQVGLRGPQASTEDFRWLREQEVKYHTMAEVERSGWRAVMDRILAEVDAAGNPVYISFDVSVMESSQMVSAGRAVPGGLTVRELIPLMRRLCAETEVAGFELADFAPMLDSSYVSALNANYMMNACLSGMALRKQGITEADYLSPLTLDHGQD